MTLQINTSTGARALTAEEQIEARTGLGAEASGAGAAAVAEHAAQADPHPGKYAAAAHTHTLLMTQPERDKLAGVAAGATANAPDAALRDRATHTGEQAISTVTDLQTALDGKAPSEDITRQMLDQHVRASLGLADDALQPGMQLTQTAVDGATAAGVALLSGADAAAQRASLGLGTAATTAATAYATAAQGAKADAALPGNADALADLLEAAPTVDPASLARIQASVSGEPVKARKRIASAAYGAHDYLRNRLARAKGGSFATMGMSPVNIRIDHGVQDFLASFFPLFEVRGIPVTVGLLTEAVGNTTHRYEPNSYTWAQLREFLGRGVDFWSHSRSHMDPVLTAALEGRTVEEVLEREIVLSAQEMEANGLYPLGWQQPGITPCLCPNYSSNFFSPGGWATDVGQMILENYGIAEVIAQQKDSTGATSATGGKYRWLPAEGNDLAHFTLDDMTLTQATGYLDTAIDFGTGIQFMVHPKFVMAGTVPWTLANMTSFLDAIVARRDAGKILPCTATALAFADMARFRRANLFAEPNFQSGILPSAAGSRWLRGGSTAVPLTIAADGSNPGNYILTQPATATGYIYQGVGTVADHVAHGNTFIVEAEVRSTGATVASQIRTSVYADNVLVPGTSRLVTVADGAWKTVRHVFGVPKGVAVLQARFERPVGNGAIEWRRVGVYPA